MSSPLSVFHHLRNYVSAGFVSALAGVISFPILTRGLTVDEYGVMGLIVSSLTLFVAIGKLGVQHSIIRFYAQVKNSNINFTLKEFYTTVLYLALGLSTITMFGWLLTGTALIPALTDSDNLTGYFYVATLFIFFRMLASTLGNVLNAQQHSKAVMLAMFIKRISYLLLVVLLLALSSINAYYVIACYVIAELLSLIYVVRAYRPTTTHGLGQFNSELASALMKFGMPLMILESMGLLLRLSDRYLIQILMDENALGQYAASYNLCSYLETIITSSLIVAVKPMYNEIWESKGRQATSDFLSSGLHLYMMIGIPFVAVFSLTAPHVMNILASPKFEPGTVVIPWVTTAILFDGAILFLAAGLYIKKNTRLLLFWGGVATVVNIVLNLLVIPKFGIVGAAAVTLLSFIVFSMGILSSSFKVLSFPIQLRNPALVTLLSFLVWLLVGKLDFASDLMGLIAKGAISTVVLIAVVLLLDRDTRQLVSSRLPVALPGVSK